MTSRPALCVHHTPTGVTLGRRRPLCGSVRFAAPQAHRIRSYSPHSQQTTAGRPSPTPGRLMRRQPAYDDLAAGQRRHVPDTPEARRRRPSPAGRPVRAGHDDAARGQVGPPVYRDSPPAPWGTRRTSSPGPKRRAPPPSTKTARQEPVEAPKLTPASAPPAGAKVTQQQLAHAPGTASLSSS
jgi:hypothetical protein